MISAVQKMSNKFGREMDDLYVIPKDIANVKKNLNRYRKKIISHKTKLEKNNSSSNIMLDYNNRKVNKSKVIKKGGKLRYPFVKQSVEKVPLVLTSKDMFNNSYINGPYKQRIKIPDSLFDTQDSISISINNPTFFDCHTKSMKNLDKITNKKKLLKSTTGKKNKNHRKSIKYQINDTCSEISISSSISAHNQIIIDENESILNKHFQRFFNNISKKSIITKNWKLSNKNNDIKNGIEKSNPLINDLFELMKIFVKNSSPFLVENEYNNKTGEINTIKDSIYQKLKINLTLHKGLKEVFNVNYSKSKPTLLPILCLNSLPNSFFEHVYMPLNQVALTTLVISKNVFDFSKSVENNIKINQYFSQNFEQIFNKNIYFHFASVDLVKNGLKPFNKIHSEFFSDEALKISFITIQKPRNKKRFSIENKSFHSNNFEMKPDKKENSSLFSGIYDVARF